MWDTTNCLFQKRYGTSSPHSIQHLREPNSVTIDNEDGSFHRNRSTSLVPTRCKNPQKHHFINTLRANLQTFECKHMTVTGTTKMWGALTCLLSMEAAGMKQGHKHSFHVFLFHTRKVFTATYKPVDKRSDS